MKSDVYNCDCVEYMRALPDNAFDLAIADPMYGIGENGSKARSRCNLAPGPKYPIIDDTPPDKSYFDELFRVSKNQIIWGANHFIEALARNSACWIVWDKVNGNNNYADCELAWTSFPGSVRKITFMWSGMMQGKSIEEGHLQQGNKALNEVRIHPCQKPVALYQWMLSRFASPSDTIFDPNLGSGSSRIAAYNMGFAFTGCEINPEVYRLQEERFARHIAQENLFIERTAEDAEQNGEDGAHD